MALEALEYVGLVGTHVYVTFIAKHCELRLLTRAREQRIRLEPTKLGLNSFSLLILINFKLMRGTPRISKPLPDV